MFKCYSKQTSAVTVPIIPIVTTELTEWLESQPVWVQQWVNHARFTAKPYSFLLVPNSAGELLQVLVGVESLDDKWALAGLPSQLPARTYHLQLDEATPRCLESLLIGWGLGSYAFNRYKKIEQDSAQLLLPKICDSQRINAVVSSVYLIRDLINTPANDMGPNQLAQAVFNMAHGFGAVVTQHSGDDLLTHRYFAVHAVGRASAEVPRVVDLVWGDPTAPKLTLVGKGVCFDSGGLNLKSSKDMLLMKKDMGGAAHVLGLAKLIMTAKLPVRLRVMIAAVENAVASNAYRPGDVIATRKGLTVEIGNTDAEGRLILADILTETCEENPDLLIDFATLTGAARVALGTEVPVFFTNREELIAPLMQASRQVQETIWPLPLYQPYRKALDSTIADLNNTADSAYGGAITAALFLQAFISAQTPWIHFDLMAWNLRSQPGRPQGGEAMGVMSLFQFLEERYPLS